MALPPGLDAFFTVGDEYRKQGAANYQNAGITAKLQEHYLGMEKERRARETLSSLPPDATMEDRIRAITPFATSKEIMDYGAKHADRQEAIAARKQQMLQQVIDEKNQLGAMQGVPTPTFRGAFEAGTNSQVDQQKAIDALNASGQKGSVQILPPGVPPAQVSSQTLEGGDFAPLFGSTNPAIAARAKQLQDAVNKGQIKAKDARTALNGLVAQESAHNQQNVNNQFKVDNEPLVPILVNGKRVLVRRSDAEGMTPGNASTTEGVNPANSNLHGEEYVSTLNPTEQQVVRGLTSYTLPLSQIPARSNQDRLNYFAHAKQTDPSFDAKEYPARQKVVNDFTSGKTADNLVAIDQAINHMGSLDKLGDALQNNDFKAVNTVINFIKDQTGNASVNNFQTAKQAVGTELMRVFRQVNASEVETLAWEKRFSEASSPEQIKGAIKEASELLVGRLNAINNRWNKGMRVSTGYPDILSPEAKQSLEGFGGKLPNAEKNTGGNIAPTGAIDFLKANPTIPMKEAFKKKYGYLPEGI